MEKSPAFSMYNVDALRVPVLLSVPHAGRDYPPEALLNLRVPPADLMRLEDRYADRLVQPAISAGIPAIIAHRARALIDLNRAEADIDPAMLSQPAKTPPQILSAKARGGLGLIPRRIQHSGELWRKPLTLADIDHRIATTHRPYHNNIRQILGAMHARFGIAILLDIHSMPPIPPNSDPTLPTGIAPQIVVGDRFGRSAAAIYTELVMAHVRGTGKAVALNNPYAGDFILQTHGQPPANIHAIQLEVDRTLYLDPPLREPSAGLAWTAQLVHDIADVLIGQTRGAAYCQAAE